VLPKVASILIVFGFHGSSDDSGVLVSTVHSESLL
jgi:hypothetical protein